MSGETDGGGAASRWDLARVVADLRRARQRWRHGHRQTEVGREGFPSLKVVEAAIDDIKGALFPRRLGPGDLGAEAEDYYVGHTLNAALTALHAQIRLELAYAAGYHRTDPASIEDRAESIVRDFAAALHEVRDILDSDVEAAYLGDPAARSVNEVLISYPGMTAIIHHRLAHRLHALGTPVIARIVSEIAHSQTGIDIHPGASIGRSFFIDHGTGVVIGETAVIGERVRLYQAVTLGAKSFPTDENGVLHKGLPRHPIIEDDVVIYAGATILGRVTIGRGSTIGGNVWLTESMPPGSRVNQASARHETRPLAHRPDLPLAEAVPQT